MAMEPNPKLSKVTVLVVDDDASIRMLLRDSMRTLGFSKIIIASDGKEALKEIEAGSIDIVLCDWVMRPMDGIGLTKAIRALNNPLKRTTPIVMITGKSELYDVQIARDAGITEYITKPFTIQQLCSRITAVVEKPRDFVIAKVFTGPDRRRRSDQATEEKRKRKPKKVKAG